jgi:hypothetical protein
VDRHAVDCQRPLGDEHRIVWIIDVAVDRLDRRNRRQRGQNRRSTDVAGMEDPRHTVENRGDRRPQQSVRVRNHTDRRHGTAAVASDVSRR